VTGQTSPAGPGTVTEAAGDVLAVVTGDRTVLHILQIQSEGRRVMTTREFLNGRKLGVGVVLGTP
jgi:methionyl-tRNA formyltransferase